MSEDSSSRARAAVISCLEANPLRKSTASMLSPVSSASAAHTRAASGVTPSTSSNE